MPGGWLLGILALSLGAWGWSLAGVMGWLPVDPDRVIGARLNLVWLSYNLLVVGSALRACVDAPKPHRHEWFQRERAGRCLWADRPVAARVHSRLVSETGAMVLMATEAALPQPGDQGWLELRDHPMASPIAGQIPADSLRLPMRIVHVGDRDRQTGERMVEVAWEPLTLAQQRSLVQWLYCQPGQWQIREAPGEFASLWLLLRCWLRPRRWQTDRRVAEAIALP
jgi:cellulose synthase (UDP-forming)